jgi:hypothetical protein
MTYHGTTYHIPIDMYLQPQDPIYPPHHIHHTGVILMIEAIHKNVGQEGMVYMPYLLG